MSSKRGVVIGSVAACSALAAGLLAFIKVKSKTKITDVLWEVKVPKHIDISWFDKDASHAKIYKIYLSNMPGIKIDQPHTYRHVIRVGPTIVEDSRCLARVEVGFEWCYFVIAKGSSHTREFEAHVLQDDSFSIANLDPRIASRNDDRLSLRVNVVSNASDFYRVYSYYPNGEVLCEDFDVKGLNSVILNLRVEEDALFSISFLRGDFESEQEILFYADKISAGRHKWDTKTNLC